MLYKGRKRVRNGLSMHSLLVKYAKKIGKQTSELNAENMNEFYEWAEKLLGKKK